MPSDLWALIGEKLWVKGQLRERSALAQVNRAARNGLGKLSFGIPRDNPAEIVKLLKRHPESWGHLARENQEAWIHEAIAAAKDGNREPAHLPILAAALAAKYREIFEQKEHELESRQHLMLHWIAVLYACEKYHTMLSQYTRLSANRFAYHAVRGDGANVAEGETRAVSRPSNWAAPHRWSADRVLRLVDWASSWAFDAKAAAGEAAWDAVRVATKAAAWDGAGDTVRKAAWNASGKGAWDAFRVATKTAAWNAAWNAARASTREAALAATWAASLPPWDAKTSDIAYSWVFGGAKPWNPVDWTSECTAMRAAENAVLMAAKNNDSHQTVGAVAYRSAETAVLLHWISEQTNVVSHLYQCAMGVLLRDEALAAALHQGVLASEKEFYAWKDRSFGAIEANESQYCFVRAMVEQLETIAHQIFKLREI